MGWGGGGAYFCKFRLLPWMISVFLPYSGPAANWLHSIAGVLTAMLWWVNWCQFSGVFMGFSCTHGQMHQCEGTNTLVEPFYLAFTATSSHLPLHEALGQFVESTLRQAEQKQGY